MKSDLGTILELATTPLYLVLKTVWKAYKE